MSLRVSIVIPTHDRADLVGDAIDSALVQDHPGVEVVVVDDGSTDRTPEVLEAYGDRIVALRTKHRERSHARNRGVEAASGELVAFLDDDDLLPPDAVTRHVATAEASGEPVIAYGRVRRQTLEGVPLPGRPRRELPEGRLFRRLLFDRFVYIIGCLVPRETVLDVGGFREELTHAEDTDLLLRLATRVPFRVTPGTVAVERDHPDRSRRDHARILEQGMAPVDLLFSWEDLPDRHRSLEPAVRAHRRLNLARSAYRLRRGRESRAHVHEALSLHWPTALRWEYWRRYLLSFVR